MISTTSVCTPYQTRFSNGAQEGISDAGADKGGGGLGFRPHELLEAALASCVNMMLQMYAANHGIPLRTVTTRVNVDRSHPDQTVFRYEFDLDGDLTDEQRQMLTHAANACPVRRTLSKQIRFESGLK